MVKKPGKNQGKYFLSCDSYKTGDKCEFKWLGYDEPEVDTFEGSDIQYVGGWEVWTESVGNKRKAPPAKAKPPPAKARAQPSKTTPNKPAARTEPQLITREELVKSLADLSRVLIAHIDEKFDELRLGPTENDSGNEECPEPGEIE